MKPINVLSLFDGISAGRLALQRAGIPVNKYYASEIDPYAIQIAQKNFPDTIQLGSITDWEKWDLFHVDLIIGGSPCQGFSNAGGRLNFNDPRSKLFFTFMDVLHFYDPDYFLLENVKMKKEWRDVITEYMGVEPILLNSALVSAQNRERYYWTNIPDITPPDDKGILLKDIVLNAKDSLIGNVRGRKLDANGVRRDSNPDIPMVQYLEVKQDGKSNSLTTVEKDNMVIEIDPVLLHNIYGGFNEDKVRVFTDKSPTIRTSAGGGHIPSVVDMDSLLHSDKAVDYMNRQIVGGRNHWDFEHHSDVRNPKSSAVVANFFRGVPYNVFKDWDCIRKLHPVECERLQTFPDNFTEGISMTQRYRCLGNSWTVDMIVHIFSKLKEII